MVEVVGEPDPDAALGRRDERGPNDVRGLAAQADVVEGELEAPAHRAHERGDGVRDLQRRLASVRQQTDFEAVPVGRYRDSALRFAL
jgi:hypothetical protein